MATYLTNSKWRNVYTDTKDINQVVPFTNEDDLPDLLTGLFGKVLKNSYPNNRLPYEFSTLNVKADISRLSVELGVLYMGLSRATLHPINTVVFPTRITDDINYKMRVCEYIPQAPGPVAPMSVPRTLQKTEYVIEGGSSRYGLSLTMENDYAKMPEGVKSFSQEMIVLVDSFVYHMAYLAFQKMLLEDPDQRSNIFLRGMQESRLQQTIVERAQRYCESYKTPLGFFSTLAYNKEVLEDLNTGQTVSMAFMPKLKRNLLTNLEQIVNYDKAGERGPDLLYGEEKILTVNGVELRTPPPVPDTFLTYDQLTQVSRNGNIAHLYIRNDQKDEKPGWYLYDGTKDKRVFLTPIDVIPHFAFFKPLKFATDEETLSFYYHIAKAGYDACDRTNGIKKSFPYDPNTPCVSYNDGFATSVGIFMEYFKRSVQEKMNGVTMNGDVQRNIVVAYYAFLDLFVRQPNILPVNYTNAGLAIYNGSSAMYGSQVAAVDRDFLEDLYKSGTTYYNNAVTSGHGLIDDDNAHYLRAIQYARHSLMLEHDIWFTFPLSYVTSENFPSASIGFDDVVSADEKDIRASLETNYARIRSYLNEPELDKDMLFDAFISCHFSTGGTGTRILAAEPLSMDDFRDPSQRKKMDVSPTNNDGYMSMKTVLFIMKIRQQFLKQTKRVMNSLFGNYHYAHHQITTQLRTVALFAGMNPTSDESIFMIDLMDMYSTCDGMQHFKGRDNYYTDENGTPKDFGLFTETSFMENNEAVIARPSDTCETQALVMVIPGEETGMTVISPPNITEGGDSAAQVLQLSYTQWMGVIILQPKRIRVVRNTFYNGYVGGNNLKFMSISRASDFAEDNWVIHSAEDACAIAIPVKKGTFQVGTFTFFKGKPFVSRVAGGTAHEDLPHSDFWNELYHVTSALTEFEVDVSGTVQCSNVLYPAYVGYQTKNGGYNFDGGATVHGPDGEQKDARYVRDTGLFPYAFKK